MPGNRPNLSVMEISLGSVVGVLPKPEPAAAVAGRTTWHPMERLFRSFLKRGMGFATLAIAAWTPWAEAAEPGIATVIERKLAARPESPAIGGPLPRPVLMVKLEERGERVGDRTDSSFWVFDPADQEKGLHRIFSGPGQGQYLRFMTPLFGGWGLASGRLDPEKEPGRDGPWFWFNLLDGKIGPTIDADFSWEWMDRGWLVSEQRMDAKDGHTVSRISRYHPLQAVARTTDLDFSYIDWLDRSHIIAVARLDAGERVVRLNAETSRYEVLADPPPGYDGNGGKFGNFSICLAGKDGQDGVYAVDGFSLWFRPTKGEWCPVIRDVHIVKTFGGSFPWLPVTYVGNGRFAVARTVKDEVKVPKTTPRDELGFGAAEAVTLLIDGVTGNVLGESAPHVYNHNPRPAIPDDWWAAGSKPKPAAAVARRKSLFQWDEETQELRFAGGKVMKLGEEDERLESEDGGHLVIFQKCPRGGGKEKTRVPFRVIDGKTGRVFSSEVESGFFEAWVDVSWQLLCAESPDAQTLKEFEDAGSGPEP